MAGVTCPADVFPRAPPPPSVTVAEALRAGRDVLRRSVPESATATLTWGNGCHGALREHPAL